MPSKLGIVAGSGSLPRKVIEAARGQGRDCFVVGFPDQTDPETLAAAPSMLSRLGAAGAMVRRMKQEGVEDLVLAGAIRRPTLAQLKPDWLAAKVMARASVRALGDDGLLRAVIREIEAQGFRVLAAQDVTGDLLMTAGLHGRNRPDGVARKDIERGLEVAAALGRVDVGQSVIVQQELVLGVEAIEGTDALIARCAALARPGPGGVLVKTMKPGQERRADLPTVGPQTVVRAAEGGLRGIAVQAGAALLLDRAQAVAEADRRGLFLLGVEPKDS